MVLVDRSAVGICGAVVSKLRAVHGISIQMTETCGGLFVLSARAAVERVTQSELVSGRAGERLRSLADRFDRPCVIVEKDRIKDDKSTGHGLQRGKRKYEEKMVALIRFGVTVLYTENDAGTASVVASLAAAERSAGHELNPGWFRDPDDAPDPMPEQAGDPRVARDWYSVSK